MSTGMVENFLGKWEYMRDWQNLLENMFVYQQHLKEYFSQLRILEI